MDLEIYIDLVFLSNFLMDYVLLRLAGAVFHCRRSRGRIVLAAMLGALSACLLLISRIQGAASVFWQGCSALLMLRVGLGLKKRTLLFRGLPVLYLMAFLCGGVWAALYKGGRPAPRMFFLLTAVTYLILRIAKRLSDSFRSREETIFPVILRSQGNQISIGGFYDTGNLLEDPVSHSPVSVLDPEEMEKLIGAETLRRLGKLKEEPGELEDTELKRLRPGFLPFHTVGSADGLILTVRLDELCIHTPEEEIRVEAPLIALPAESFAFGKEYKLILNARLMD